MKNKLKYFISITAFFSFVFSQISLDDINNINNAQLDLIKDQDEKRFYKLMLDKCLI